MCLCFIVLMFCLLMFCHTPEMPIKSADDQFKKCSLGVGWLWINADNFLYETANQIKIIMQKGHYKINLMNFVQQ